MPAILWTNTMTEKGAEKYVSKEDYIIQVCSTILIMIKVVGLWNIINSKSSVIIYVCPNPHDQSF